MSIVQGTTVRNFKVRDIWFSLLLLMTKSYKSKKLELFKVTVLLVIRDKPQTLAQDILGTPYRMLIQVFLLVCLQQLCHICEKFKNDVYSSVLNGAAGLLTLTSIVFGRVV